MSYLKLPFFFPQHLVTTFPLDYITGEKRSEWLINPGKLIDELTNLSKIGIEKFEVERL